MPTASTASTSRARPTTSYYKDVNGNGAQDGGDTAVNSANLIQEEGDYVLVITCTDKGDYVNQSVEVPFSIAADQAESTFALGMVTGQADGQPVIDTDGIVFSGVQRGDAFGRDTGKIAFTVDGQFTPMNGVKLYRGTNMTAGAEMKDTDVLYEGDYTALVIYGSGAKTAVVKFHVGAFDLSKATVTHPAVDKAPVNPIDASTLAISGASDQLKALLAVTYKGDTPQASISKKGFYSFSVAVDPAKDNANKDLARSITGSKDFKVNYVTSLAKFKYNGSEVANGQALDLKDAAFNPDKLTAEAAGKDLDGKYTVTVLDASGNEVDEWTAGGTYTVVAEVNDATYATGGSVSFTFSVAKPELKTDGIYVEYNGKLTDAIEKTYDGEDVVKGVSVKVVNGKKTMTEGVDYKLVYNVKGGKEVSEIVDAGEYTLTVKPITFDFNDQQNVVNIKVGKVQLKDVRVANQVTVAVPNEDPKKPDVEKTGLPYTSSAIVPTFEYNTGEKDAEGKDVYAAVPSDIYTLAYTNSQSEYIDKVVEVGAYRAHLTLNANVKNYEFGSNPSSCRFEVIKASRFLDVPSSEWYYDEVNEAASKGWIKGYADGSFFGPNDNITRADVCVIVARMAGVDLAIDSENWGSETSFYETPFADVDGHMYYAQAIAWAADAGIVQGDGGTGNFRPGDKISRSEFAAVMMRYAQKAGDDTAVEDGALDGYADADQVPAWFQGEVAWAVEAGIMGVGTEVLDPNGDITRAQVAAMAVRL